MSGTSLPPSLQQDIPGGEPEPFVTAEPGTGTENREGTSRPDRRLKNALKERIQAGTAHFEFDALLQGVSTLQSPAIASLHASPSILEPPVGVVPLPTLEVPPVFNPESDVKENRFNPKDGTELIWIPAGEFLMGSIEGERREQPVHRVYLDGFWIYKTQVTVRQYRQFCLDTGRSFRHEPPWGWQDEHPMVNVSWEYASAYAQWAGGALPTEAEWEKAARGTDGRQFPWGSEWNAQNCRNSVDDRQNGVAYVGSYPEGASPFGVLDMAGNVWEWTADWFEQIYYTFSPEKNPTGPPFGSHRVLRGGSWGNDLMHDYRTTTRVVCEPMVRGGSIGFRCIVRDDAHLSNGSCE